MSDHELLKSFFVSNPETAGERGIAKRCFDALGFFIIVVDRNWRIIFVNKRAAEVLERTGNDLTGKSFINKLVVNDHQKGVRAGLKELFNANSKVSSVNILYRLRSAGRNEKIIDSESKKIVDDTGSLLGILISGKDVTEYNVSQKNLKKDINLYRILLNKIPEVNVFVFDRDKRFTLAEGIEMNNMGLSPADFDDKDLSDIPLKKLKKIWEPLFESVLQGESISKEYKVCNYNYLFRASPLRDTDGNIHSGLVVTRNVTGQKLSEKILRKAKDEAVKSVDVKTDFLARVSHEIRTPLNAIMGFTEQLLQTELSSLQGEYVNIINNSSELLLSLINDLLVMSKIDADQIRFDVQPFNIRNTINYVYKAGSGRLDGTKVLVVEDDSINMLLATTILKKLKCIVDTANNGTKAIEKLKSETFDLILLDIRLPDINGVEVAKYLRSTRNGKGTKIIALTAQAMKDDIIRYEEAGINDFVIKPFKEAYLYNKICEVLSLAKVTAHKSKTEVILRSEMDPKPYDLYELNIMAGNDTGFINNTLELFIENSENAVESFKHYLKKKDYKQIGETAHKILPSFRHLEVDAVIPRLTELKTRTLINKDPGDIDDLVSDTVREIESLMDILRKEISKKSNNLS